MKKNEPSMIHVFTANVKSKLKKHKENVSCLISFGVQSWNQVEVDKAVLIQPFEALGKRGKGKKHCS